MTAPLRQQIPLPSLSSRDRDGVAVVSLSGELDFCGSSALQAYLSGIRRQTRPRSIADLTALAFIDCACLTVLVRHCTDSREQGGSFALAGPHGAVHRILAVNGLLTWFDVHDTVDEAVSRTGAQRSPVLAAIPPGAAGASCSGTLTDTDLSLSSRPAWVWAHLSGAAGRAAAKRVVWRWWSHGSEEGRDRRQEQGPLQAAP